MGYFVDRVVICDAYSEPDRHYRLKPGGKAKLTPGRRSSVRFLASGKETKSGIAGILGKQASLFEDMSPANEYPNEFVNELRCEVGEWRKSGYQNPPGVSLVTRRLLEWWFEREEERRAQRRRFFFCQREAVETVIYLYEVRNRQKMPETGDLVRYALKMATGTGKTLVMALLVTWSTLHKKKVSNSTLSTNFLVIVPNLTVRDRVGGHPRGDGLDPSGSENLFSKFDTVPPEYVDDFSPEITVRNWQAMNTTPTRSDWIPDEFEDEGRFVPASVLWAIRRRHRRDPDTDVREMIGKCRDLVVINDEAHHVYGEKKVAKGEKPDYIKWNSILRNISRVAKVGLVVDLSATPWYGSGSPKPDGTLFEWLISDFSVYDAFESGLIKVVRLPEEQDRGRVYLDLWDDVKGAKSKEDYLSGCKGAIEHIYSSWKEEYQAWSSQLEFARGPCPVILLVASDATRASWLFEHISKDYALLRNSSDKDPRKWVTIQVDSGVFDAERGNEAVLREMVNTVGINGRAGEHVRCIISVNMLTEGWDVKSVTNILGLRAFGSPLLTEQVIGRGLRLTNYGILNQPFEERPAGYEETMDAFGIPFVGFPVERRKRPATGEWGQKPLWVETQPARVAYRIIAPNVTSWAVGVLEALSDIVKVSVLPKVTLRASETPPEVWVSPVVGNEPQKLMTFEQIREEYPVVRSAFLVAKELLERTNPSEAGALPIGPTFDELIDFVFDYLDNGIVVEDQMDHRDVAIWYWRKKVLDVLYNGIKNSNRNGVRGIPILGKPDWLDSSNLRRFQWTGITYKGTKTHTNLVACHTDLESAFARFMDSANDVERYMKNEGLGFSLTYYYGSRPKQYYPDFLVVQRERAGEIYWIVETKGEIRPDTILKAEAAELWCKRISGQSYGEWKYLLVPQQNFERALAAGVKSLGGLAQRLRALSSARM